MAQAHEGNVEHVILQLVLEELGLVSDWSKSINARLVAHVVEDMYQTEVIDLGYRLHPDQDREMTGPYLMRDIDEILFQVRAEGIAHAPAHGKELVPYFKKRLHAYKRSESFKGLVAKMDESR